MSRKPDVIIVGTGMGGATFGYACAQAGLKVLFLEKGHSHLRRPDALTGNFAELFFPKTEAPALKHAELLARAGRCFEEITDVVHPRQRRFIPFIGCGTGGSSALYGMALERFRSEDFQPRRKHAALPHAASLPETWPIAYEEFCFYYEKIERLFGVRSGEPIGFATEKRSLQSPPPLHPANRRLAEYLRLAGMHPYRLPLACNYQRGADRVQSFLDADGVKNDAATVCLRPALERYGAQLLDDCEVLRLESDRRRVKEVVCLRQGRILRLAAETVVLAAGALNTPRILLESHSPLQPNGLANRSGLVGRNLMRHYVDIYALKTDPRDDGRGNIKELAFNDFYAGPNGAYGTVQSFGVLPPAEVLAAQLAKDLRDKPLSAAGALLEAGKPIISLLLRKIFAGRVLLASIIEDFPLAENRVTLSSSHDNFGRRGLRLHYRIPSGEAARAVALRKKLCSLLKPFHPLLLKQAENNERLAHVCGTCRFGDDPRNSVLNAACRAHDVENLFVADASFFPTSGGTNPALTIAAGALRAAEYLLGQTSPARVADVLVGART